MIWHLGIITSLGERGGERIRIVMLTLLVSHIESKRSHTVRIKRNKISYCWMQQEDPLDTEM